MDQSPQDTVTTKTFLECAFSDLKTEYERGLETLNRFAAAIGDTPLPQCSILLSSGGGCIQIMAYSTYLKVLRALRPLADGPATQSSIFPAKDSNKANVWYLLKINQIEIHICGSVDDFTTLLKPGATCKRKPVYDQVVCE